jgi:mono/diheme cytochrome c family protein
MISHRLTFTGATVVAAFLAAALINPSSAFGADAATNFKKKCAACHGKAGEPNKVFAKQGVRSFKDAEWQKATKDAQIEESIRKGKKGTLMAGFAKQLSDDEITALVAYVRKFGPKE